DGNSRRWRSQDAVGQLRFVSERLPLLPVRRAPPYGLPGTGMHGGPWWRRGNAREAVGTAYGPRFKGSSPMPSPREIDPAESPLTFFGSELRHYRTKAGLTIEQLAEKINYSTSQISAIETGKRPPTREFARLADDALGTDDALTRLWPLTRKSPFP